MKKEKAGVTETVKREPKSTVYSNSLRLAHAKKSDEIHIDFALTSVDYPSINEAPIMARVYCSSNLAINLAKMIVKELGISLEDVKKWEQEEKKQK